MWSNKEVTSGERAEEGQKRPKMRHREEKWEEMFIFDHLF
jgi:hypothetical protein